MPLYVYVCPACELEVEELRPIGRADDPIACPVCQAELSRAVTTFSLNGRAQAPKTAGPAQPQAARHRVGCPCCAPPPRPTRPTPKTG